MACEPLPRVQPPLSHASAGEAALSVPRGTALYVGALLGPGLLLLPGLAAAEAGPASIIAWLGLLGLSALFAVVFRALGRAQPNAGGVAGYTASGLGAPAGTAAAACFLVGVVCGAPLVCLIGATYVTDLIGGGTALRCGIAAALLLAVLFLAAAGSAPQAAAANWLPFAPHGWASVGHAAATLMFSFVGWEAVAPLTG